MVGATGRQPIYLDYNATTPIAAPVLAVMLPYLRDYFGNPSSDHVYGREAAAAIERARAQIAGLLGATPDEIVFTGGGSESDNQALLGRVWTSRLAQPHIVTSAVEHPAVLTTCRFLETRGVAVSYLRVDPTGMVDPDDVRRALRPETVVVSVMHANNEVGTIQPITEIAEVCRAADIPFHTDAAQSVGKLATKVDELGVDLLTIAGHKLYAPKGIGALYVRRGTPLESLIHGAGHERGRRAGTENTAFIVPLGAAAALAEQSLAREGERQRALRDRLQARLQEQAGATLNGHPVARLPNTLSLRFAGLDGNQLLAATPAIAASTGSACHAGVSEPSAVLLAMGIAPGDAIGTLRLSLGRPTTEDEVDAAAAAVTSSVRRLHASTAAPRAQA